ncbi:MAG: thioredoxin [Holophagaceae bacterium]|nr:thioredoxin [Holophagaceae bacterium]
MSDLVAHITDAEFPQAVAPGRHPRGFLGPWCGPCKMIAPVLDELAAEMTGKAKFVKMNVDENPQVAGQFGIMSIPTLIVFKDGKPVNKLIGGQPKPQLKAFVEGAF